MSTSEIHPFKAPCDRSRMMLQLERQAAERHVWRRNAALLEANPGLSVFPAQHCVMQDHGCVMARTMVLSYHWKGTEEGTGLTFCLDCNRVGVTWDVDWIVPEALQERLAPILRRFEAPRRPDFTEAPCPRCQTPARVSVAEGHVLLDGSLDYSLDCDHCDTVTIQAGKHALEQAREAQRRRDDVLRQLAKDTYHDEGSVEVDDNAPLSHGDDGGAYVQAWVWVDAADLDEAHQPGAGETA